MCDKNTILILNMKKYIAHECPIHKYIFWASECLSGLVSLESSQSGVSSEV